MSYLFIKKSVSKRKVCVYFHKNQKLKKTPKNIFSGFFYVGIFGFFWVGFLGGFFIANPACRRRRGARRPAPGYSSATGPARRRAASKGLCHEMEFIIFCVSPVLRFHEILVGTDPDPRIHTSD
jgi:hypothetical protein